MTAGLSGHDRSQELTNAARPSSETKAYQESDKAGRMLPSSCYDDVDELAGRRKPELFLPDTLVKRGQHVRRTEGKCGACADMTLRAHHMSEMFEEIRYRRMPIGELGYRRRRVGESDDRQRRFQTQ
ncbi:hypothetical protein [Sphingopyxis terrae]|uniref:hypothetical protein n=1 Tax=Sphingopyxis terrae TaxID=33052 RepID=UPI003F80E6E4